MWQNRREAFEAAATVWPDLAIVLYFGQLFKAQGNNYFVRITNAY